MMMRLQNNYEMYLNERPEYLTGLNAFDYSKSRALAVIQVVISVNLCVLEQKLKGSLRNEKCIMSLIFWQGRLLMLCAK